MSDGDSIDRDEQRRARDRAAYAKNAEKYREKCRRWRRENHAAHAASVKKSREKCREAANSRKRESYAKSREQRLEEARRYRHENVEKCRERRRASHQKNRERENEQGRQRCRDTRAFLDQILRQCPCMDCGETDWRCLEFHHNDPEEKHAAVTAMTGHSRARLLREINLCDVVCANCHLRRHARDGVVACNRKPVPPGKPKPRPAMPDEELTPEQRRTRECNLRYRERRLEELREYNRSYHRARYAENKAKLDTIKAESGCIRCGEKDPVCLEFHHRDPERRNAQVAALCGFNSKRMMEEVALCDVTCASCHRKAHPREDTLERRRRKKAAASV